MYNDIFLAVLFEPFVVPLLKINFTSTSMPESKKFELEDLYTSNSAAAELLIFVSVMVCCTVVIVGLLELAIEGDLALPIEGDLTSKVNGV
jgi:hypothetical protein|tara:strand:+ start:444 stop:716 length:273 start_codon:yes stop_codon:yes gene_type:complete